MDRSDTVVAIRNKYRLLRSELDERTRRLWAATEATAIGWGGVSIVSEATGIAHTTIRKGARDLEDIEDGVADKGPFRRIRRSGGGRKSVLENDPQLSEALETIIESTTRGDPECALRWTCKSTRRLAAELKQLGHEVGPTSVRMMLHALDYSLQANRKTHEGSEHPDRDAQFHFINERVKAFFRSGQPVISVDTKKKELVGDFSNVGREYQKKGAAIKTRMHDFADKELGKAIPYGVYDLKSNEGWVAVGINHDTARFAVNSIRRWWTEMGSRRFPRATRLLITADAGGSNGSRTRLWKLCLQELANELSMNISVCHFPPGTSKWNKIEHRLFTFITQNWRGKPLYDLVTIVNLISHTTTATGLLVKSAIDEAVYEKGIKVTDEQIARIAIVPHTFHGDWNYTIRKQKTY